MTTAPDKDGRCSNCRSTREACEARADSWPPYCCPACLRTDAWRTHLEQPRVGGWLGPAVVVTGGGEPCPQALHIAAAATAARRAPSGTAV